MKNFLLLSFFAACVADTVPSSGIYFAYAQLRPSWAVIGGDNTNRGLVSFEYNAGSNVLTYSVAVAQAEFGLVGLYGPASCENRGVNSEQTGTYQFNFYTIGDQRADNCVNNQGKLQIELGYGPPQGSALISQTTSLNDEQERMLFNRALYVRVDNEIRPMGYARGQVILYDNGGNNNRWFQSISLAQNPGTYGENGDITSSQNVAFGYVSHDVGSNSLSFDIWNNINQPGSIALKCGEPGEERTHLVDGDGSNHFTGSTTFPDANLEMLLDMKRPGKCYFVVRSAEFPNGELYGSTQNMVDYEMLAESDDASVDKWGFAQVSYREQSKMLEFLIQHNIGAGNLTGCHVHLGGEGENGEVVCDLFAGTPSLNPRVRCFVHENMTEAVNNEGLYVNFHTTDVPAGLIRGQIKITGAIANPGLSSGAVAGIAIAATVIGLIALAGLGYLGYLGYKKGFSSSRL